MYTLAVIEKSRGNAIVLTRLLSYMDKSPTPEKVVVHVMVVGY